MFRLTQLLPYAKLELMPLTSFKLQRIGESF